jgi:hypothetical protein
MMERLKEKCQTIWQNGHRRCEQRSLTGQLCHFMVSNKHINKGIYIYYLIRDGINLGINNV